MKTHKYLASANTSLGFKNCFDSINKHKNGFTYILKGGPGTGKSTIMKKIGNYFENKGYFVEYFYCSSDDNSLDGVKIKNISIVDGTSPHVVEATLPNIKDKIINVGEYISENVKQDKLKIEKLMEKKASCYTLAYSYFAAIGSTIKAEELEEKKFSKKEQKFSDVTSRVALYTKNTSNTSAEKQVIRTLFCSYISPTGVKSFYKDNSYKSVIKLRGNFIKNQKVFDNLINKLNENNFSYTKFLSVFNPNKLEAIFIHNNQTLVVCEDIYEAKIACKNQGIINKLIKKVAKLLSKAKFYHKQVENYYIKNMNFDDLQTKTNSLLIEIEQQLKN